MSDDIIISAVAGYYSNYFCNTLYAIAQNDTSKNIAVSYQITVKNYINSISNDNTFGIIRQDINKISMLKSVENDTRIMSSGNKVLSVLYTILTISGVKLQGKSQDEIINIGLKFMMTTSCNFGLLLIQEKYLSPIINSRTKKDGIELEETYMRVLLNNQIQLNTGNNMDENRKIDVTHIKIIQDITVKYNDLRKKYIKLSEENKNNVNIIKLLANQNTQLKNKINENISYNDDFNDPDDNISEITFNMAPTVVEEATPTEFSEKFEENFDKLEKKLDNIIVSKPIQNDDESIIDDKSTLISLYDDDDDDE